MTLSTFLDGLAQEVGPDQLEGGIVLVALDRPVDDLIRLALGLGPYHPGERSRWSHTFLIAEPYRGAQTRILDCTIRNPEGKVAWNELLSELLKNGITASGAIYEGVVADYDDSRVSNQSVKLVFTLTPEQRRAVVQAAEVLKNENTHYDLPGLVRELVRLLTGIPIPAREKLLFCSAFCQAAYRNALGSSGDFAPTIATADATPDDIWFSPLGNGVQAPAPSTTPAKAFSAAVALDSLADPPGKTQTEHVVVLMLENRSFDHALGSLSLAGTAAIDGLKAGMANPNGKGQPRPIFRSTTPKLEPDPHHDLSNVLKQLAGPNQGFVTNYETVFKPADVQGAEKIMGYFDSAMMPVLHRLAVEYGVSDAWFCSLPSETWPNRLFIHGATSDGHVANGLPRTFPPKFYSFPTIYQRLGEAPGDWAIYNDQLPQSVCIGSLLKEWLRSVFTSTSHFRGMDQFDADCQAGTLPKYSFIEPRYFGGGANDDHPPHDTWRGQELIARVYNALRTGPAWERTLFVILYDEHGGLFDHVQPPTGVPAPTTGMTTGGFTFQQLGPRVPAVIVSSWIPRGTIVRPPEGGFLDHTSILATIEKRWQLPPLTNRDAAATDLWPYLTEAAPREDDAQTVAFLQTWQPPQDLMSSRLEMAARDTLEAPVAEKPGRTGLEIATAIGSLKGRASGSIQLDAAAGPTSTGLSPYQESLVDLANSILESEGQA